jgi:hypothetical protein
VTALRLCLERLVPPCREAPISLDLPRLQTRADAARVLSFLLADAGRGEVTPGEAEKLVRLVSEHHKAVQLTEIEESLRELKEALGLVPGPGTYPARSLIAWPQPMRFNTSPCSRSSRASSRSLARVPPCKGYAIPAPYPLRTSV